MAVPDGMKYCPRCEVVKGHDEFHRARSQYDGLSAHCKACRAIAGRRGHFLRHYGLEPEDVEAMLVRQKWLCSICKRGIGRETAHVDHDHDTGVVRALLCFTCNSALGKFRDDPAVLRRAACYLEGDVWAPIELAPGVWTLPS